MSEKENEVEEKVIEEKATEEKASKASKADKQKDKNATKSSGSGGAVHALRTWFNDIRGEFRKIVWPSRKELMKKTITVIITCFLFGIVIVSYDSFFNAVMLMITKFTA